MVQKLKVSCKSDAVLRSDRIGVRLIYSDASQGWVTITSANETAPALASEYVCASGGTETTSGDYKIHTFTGDGTFTVSSSGNIYQLIKRLFSCWWWWRWKDHGGGGGAGGYRFSNGTASVILLDRQIRFNRFTCVCTTTYPITIGAGGTGGSAVQF